MPTGEIYENVAELRKLDAVNEGSTQVGYAKVGEAIE